MTSRRVKRSSEGRFVPTEYLEVNGEKVSLAELSRRSGVSLPTIRARRMAGWPSWELERPVRNNPVAPKLAALDVGGMTIIQTSGRRSIMARLAEARRWTGKQFVIVNESGKVYTIKRTA